MAVALLEVPGRGIVLGLARCRSFTFPPMSSYELAHELAVIDAAEKLQHHQRGRCEPPPTAAIESWRMRIIRWKADWGHEG
jgi:hypothetical protein